MASTKEFSCRELVELITEYLENAMAAPERQRFEKHIYGCKGCERYLDQFRQTIRTLGHLDEADIEPAARDRLLGAFRTWKQASPA